MNIYAHRGNSGFFPENTMYASKKSLDLGIYGIEIDVQKTKDGILVVHHDETLGRMFDGKGSIKKSTFEQLRELNLKDEELKNKADCKIPTLEEVLEFIKDKIIICHNKQFEEKFLEFHIGELKNKFLDSMELACVLEPFQREFNLDYLKKQITKDKNDEKHRALSDTIDTIDVVNALILRFKDR